MSHKKGDTVMIYNSTLSGAVVEEGYAKLIKRLFDNYWRVQFSDKSLCERFVREDAPKK